MYDAWNYDVDELVVTVNMKIERDWLPFFSNFIRSGTIFVCGRYSSVMRALNEIRRLKNHKWDRALVCCLYVESVNDAANILLYERFYCVFGCMMCKMQLHSTYDNIAHRW